CRCGFAGTAHACYENDAFVFDHIRHLPYLHYFTIAQMVSQRIPSEQYVKTSFLNLMRFRQIKNR
ncbi:MAG: hypothetical protein Q4B44_07270, partial [Erysipelotrichaceae bacterium]|nr:hypothetical protein [Erysipelotrichaceae bacterium]